MTTDLDLPPTITKRAVTHPMWATYQRMIEEGTWPDSLPPIIGEIQYWYESKKGKIDAILLPNYFCDNVDIWEIYSEGILFDDIERYRTLEEAEKRIKELLT